MEYQRANQRFLPGGLDLNHPVDLIPPGKYSYLSNVRSYQEGRIESRFGLQRVNATPTSDTFIHSGFRLNDYLANSFLRFLGIGTHLYTGQSTFSSLDTGFSGNPLSFVPYLPLRSANDFVYIADSNKMAKVNVAGTEYSMGIKPPNTIPSVELSQPAYTTLTGSDATDPFNVSGSWGNSGHSTTPALNPVGMPGRITNTSIGTILYTIGTTGWACIAPTGGNNASGPPGMVAGMRMQLGTGGAGTAPPTGNVEYFVLEEVHKLYSAASPTIGEIIYDSGTTGLCTVQPSVNIAGLARNAMLELNSEFVRIISVTAGPNGISSFRCSTTGTHAAAESITLPTQGSLWCYLVLTHAAGEFFWQNVFQYSINPGSTGGTGQVYNNYGSSIYNLSVAGGRPLTGDDYINISMWVNNPQFLSEVQVIFDVDSGTSTSHAATDGTRNAYYVTFRASNFQQYISNQQLSDTERTTAIQLDLQQVTTVPLATPKAPPTALGSGLNSTPVDQASTADSNPPLPVLGSATNQMYTGATQWTEMHFKISDLLATGADKTADLSQIHAILFNFTVVNTIIVSMAGMWAGGGYGPDSGNGATPFIYRYRYRANTIGSESLPGPALRSGVQALRQGVILTATASTDPQVDKIDFERLGGPNLTWNYVGTADNSVAVLLDDQLSAAVAGNQPLETDTYQPFTISGAPLTGLKATVAGTAIHLTTGIVNTNMCIGTEVIINGVYSQVYAQPASTTLFHITDSLGFGTGVTVDILEPVLSNQPLPAMWGPFEECLLACGNNLNSGGLYFTKPQDPDSSSDANYISIGSPSEMLMNGVIFDTKCFVWSDQGMFQIIPTPGQPNMFQGARINNSKGLISRWAVTSGPLMYFVSHDGVYMTGGGEPIEISGDIQLLFPKDNRPGEEVRGIQPIDVTKLIILNYIDGFLYLDYTDITGILHTLVCDVSAQSQNLALRAPIAWYLDTYNLTSSGVLSHYVESEVSQGKQTKQLMAGGNNGVLYTYAGFQDDGNPINWQVNTIAFNAGDARANKLWGDTVFDLDPAGGIITTVPWINNFSSSLAGTTYSGTHEIITNPFDFVIDQFAKNLGFIFSGATTTSSQKLFFWEPSFLIRPEDTANRATDWDDDGYKGAKFLQGFLLEIDTEGQKKTFQIEIDYNTVQTFTVTASGQQWIPFTLSPAFIGHLFRIVPIGSESDVWRLFGIKWVWEPAPELVTRWETQETTHDMPGYQFLKDGYLAVVSSSPVTIQILVDNVSFTATIPSSNGLYYKFYLLWPALTSGKTLKGKAFKYILTSPSPFRLFQKDCEVRVHSWYGGDYVVKNPFGDISRVSGARI